MSTIDRVRTAVEPLVAESGLSLYDVELNKDLLRISVQGPPGTDLDVLARLSRSISHLLDEEDPVAGRYTLEVSSPGLERALRRPEHYRDAVGEIVSVKTHPGVEGDRRIRGVLTEADDDGVVVEPEPADGDGAAEARRLAYADISRASTVFDWGPAEQPGPSRSHRKAAS
jgi:ribosome maturation factor RimP